MDRKIVLNILKKMDVDFTSRIDNEKAIRKLKRNARQKGLPERLSEKECELLNRLEISIIRAVPKSIPENNIPEKPPIKNKKEIKSKRINKKRKYSLNQAAAESLLNPEIKTQKDVENHTVKLYLEHGNKNSDKLIKYARVSVQQVARIFGYAGIPESKKINLR